MVYDNTADDFKGYNLEVQNEPGFAIHDSEWTANELNEHRYSLFTDDGRGNGDYVCGSSDIYWIRRIALALDSYKG